MKIADSENIKNISTPGSSKTEKSVDKEFVEILNKKIEKLNISSPETKPSNRLNRVSEAHLRSAISKKEVVLKVAKFLDAIEEYSERLSIPQNSLKDISHLIEKIESETKQLKLISDALSPNDEIKNLLDEALIRSSVEVIKFNRGDYLNH
jgi:hypothetical protein